MTLLLVYLFFLMSILNLFVGCIINFIVSYLLCMFQDSVPAGSYNDPFLSSVISTVAPTWCHGAMEPLKATLFRVSDDCPDCRINIF